MAQDDEPSSTRRASKLNSEKTKEPLEEGLYKVGEMTGPRVSILGEAPPDPEDVPAPEPALDLGPKTQAFVFLADEFMGMHIAKHLKANHHEVSGTLGAMEPHKKPAYLYDAYHVPRVSRAKETAIDRPVSRNAVRLIQDRKNMLEKILSSELIVIPLVGMEANLKEVLSALSSLDEDLLQKKTVVGITTPLSWAKTVPFKTFDEGPGGLSERDEPRRKGLPSTRATAEAERVLLRARAHYATKGLNTFVVCPGVLYGNGELEDGFLRLFKTAWESESPVPLYGDGDNYIPTLHIEDLANRVIALHKQRPQQQYMLACDRSPCTLRSITQAIADAFCTEVETIPKSELFLQTGLENLLINLPMKPSTFLDPPVEPKFEMDGVVSNVDALKLTFLQANNLKPLRIMIWGPPVAGKTSMAEVISKQYYLKRIHAKYLVDEVLPEQSDEFKSAVEERKYVPDNVPKAAASKPAAGKKGKGGDEAPATATPEPVQPRLADEDMLALCKIALAKAECQNQGYILDGFPKTYQMMKELFTEVVEPPPPTPEDLEKARLAEEAKAAAAAEAEAAAAAAAAAAKGKKGKPPPKPAQAAVEPEPEPEPELRVVTASTVPYTFISLEVTEEEQTARVEARALEATLKAQAARRESVEAELLAFKDTDAYQAALAEGRVAELEMPAAVPTEEEVEAEREAEVACARELLARRMAKWTESQEEPNKPVSSLFEEFPICTENGSVIKVSLEQNTKANQENLLDLIRQSFGRPHNFKGFAGEDVVKQLTDDEIAAQDKKREDEKLALAARLKHEAKIKEIRDLETVNQNNRFHEEMRIRAEPVRKYLLNSLMPHITEGLLLACKNRPEDAIDFMTNFLLTESANANDANKFIRFGRRNSRAFVKDRHTARTAEHKRRTRRRVSINLVPTEHPA